MDGQGRLQVQSPGPGGRLRLSSARVRGRLQLKIRW
jgi:hypothetical protein